MSLFYFTQMTNEVKKRLNQVKVPLRASPKGVSQILGTACMFLNDRMFVKSSVTELQFFHVSKTNLMLICITGSWE